MIRVRYADTDQMSIVNNARYLEYFEVGRTELLRSAGLPYAELEKSGFYLPLIEAYCKYSLPAVYDDKLIVESCVFSVQNPRLRIEYSIFRESTGELLCSGFTVHAFQDIRLGKAVRPPKIFTDLFRKER